MCLSIYSSDKGPGDAGAVGLGTSLEEARGWGLAARSSVSESPVLCEASLTSLLISVPVLFPEFSLPCVVKAWVAAPVLPQPIFSGLILLRLEVNTTS